MQSQPRQRRSERKRAQYPEDAVKPAYPTYPDYPSAPSYPAQEDTWQQPQANHNPAPSYQQNTFYQPPQTSYPAQPQYSRFASQQQPMQPPRPPRGNAYEGGEPLRRGHSHDGLWLFVIILCIILLALGTLLFVRALLKKKLFRWQGAALLAIYVAFVTVQVLIALHVL